MFKNSYQSGLLSIFYSCGSNPLALWEMEVNNGHIKRLTDNEVNSIVLEIVSTNVATTYITCPPNGKYLGIKLPFLVMIVKNLKRYFSFEITILDDKNMRRRFRISNFQSTTKIKPFCTTMPIGLSGGWNQIQFNLADFTRRAYGSQFIETLRMQVHANVRLRRIYFAERLYTEDELPQEYKLYLPLEKGKKAAIKKEPQAVKEAPPAGTEGAPEEQAVPQVEPEVHPAAPVTSRKSLEHKKSTTESKKSGTKVGKKASAAESPEIKAEKEGEEGAEAEGEEGAEVGEKEVREAEEMRETGEGAPDIAEGEAPETTVVEEPAEEQVESVKTETGEAVIEAPAEEATIKEEPAEEVVEEPAEATEETNEAPGDEEPGDT